AAIVAEREARQHGRAEAADQFEGAGVEKKIPPVKLHFQRRLAVRTIDDQEMHDAIFPQGSDQLPECANPLPGFFREINVFPSRFGTPAALNDFLAEAAGAANLIAILGEDRSYHAAEAVVVTGDQH